MQMGERRESRAPGRHRRAQWTQARVRPVPICRAWCQSHLPSALQPALRGATRGGGVATPTPPLPRRSQVVPPKLLITAPQAALEGILARSGQSLQSTHTTGAPRQRAVSRWARQPVPIWCTRAASIRNHWGCRPEGDAPPEAGRARPQDPEVRPTRLRRRGDAAPSSALRLWWCRAYLQRQ